MASIYQLIPLPLGPLAPYDLTTRAVLGAIWDRYRLSSYQVTGGNDKWYDYDVDEVYCVYDQTDLAQMLGVSRRTVQRALDVLRADRIVWSRKPGLQSACRYYIDESIRSYLRQPQLCQTDAAIASD